MGDPVVQLVRHIAAPISRTRAFRTIGPRVLPPIEAFMARVTGRRVQVSALLVPSLVLHTIGRKSGVERSSVLMYTPDGHGRAIVAGSNFAGGRHPAWTLNLAEHPEAEITVKGVRMPVVATRVPEEERDAVWARIESQWPGYRGYERASGRVVRLFRLRPVRRALWDPTAS